MSWEKVGVIAGVVGALAAVAALAHEVIVRKEDPGSIEKITFSCGTSQDGTPTTFAQAPRGKIPVIRWVSTYFSQSGFDPQKRCEEVSQRFQDYSNKGVLSFITTGIENNQEVICVSRKEGGACSGTLFTLKQGQSASRTIQQLFDVAYRGSAPLEESSSSAKIYVNLKKLLDTAPVESK